jgi:hypothetical protein
MSKLFPVAVLLLCTATIAGAQPSAAPPAPAAPRAPCADCGVITSVRSISKQEAAAAAPAHNPSNDSPPGALDETKPPGLIATIPLGGGKPKVGSATKVGQDAPVVTKQWEVIVRLDGGQFRVLTLEAQPDYAKGDRVRIVDGKLEAAGN